ncbi:MAG: hypothetical protein ACRC6U_10045 [Fusobacteriaceae bacterium]
MFKVRDRVWDVKWGWGEVIRTENTTYYKDVLVLWDSGSSLGYSKDGAEQAGANRSLFFDEVQIPESALIIPECRYRASLCQTYYYVEKNGEICSTAGYNRFRGSDLYECGNHFETEEEAMNSDLYKSYIR